MTTELTRRGLLVGLAALGLAAAGCNASSNTAAPAGGDSSAAAGFSWTDGRGTKIDLPAIPTVVVAQSSAAATLWDFGYQVKGAYGELRTINGKLNYQAGDLDLSKVTVIGDTYEVFDVEKYAAMNPQLLIDLNFTAGQLWYVPKGATKQVEALAPTLGVEMLNLDMLQIIEEFAKLAGALGADLTTSEVAESKTAFEAAVAKIKAAAAAKPDLTVVGMSLAKTGYIANPKQQPDFAYLEKLGVKFVQPGGSATDYFTPVSWEKIDEFDADVILLDARAATWKSDAEAQPTFRALPAVKAGQYYEWKAAAPYSYKTQAALMEAFATQLEGAKKVT